jgi:hypothetical protein
MSFSHSNTSKKLEILTRFLACVRTHPDRRGTLVVLVDSPHGLIHPEMFLVQPSGDLTTYSYKHLPLHQPEIFGDLDVPAFVSGLFSLINSPPVMKLVHEHNRLS